MLLFNPYEEDYSLGFRSIKNDTMIDFDSWVYLRKEQAVVVFGSFNLTPTNIKWQGLAEPVVGGECYASWLGAVSSVSSVNWGALLKRAGSAPPDVVANATKEYDIKGKIAGYKALLVGYNKVIWISHHHLFFLDKE